jgi:hypothetical protein
MAIGVCLIIGVQLVGYLTLSLVARIPAFPWAVLVPIASLIGVIGLTLVLFGLFRVVAGPRLDKLSNR